MRWQNLFADLEGELDALEAAERWGEVAERTRAELAVLAWADRLADAGREVALELLGGGTVHGEVAVVGAGWAVLAATRRSVPGPVALVRLDAVLSAQGLGHRSRVPARSEVARRLSFAAALRRVARDRSAVALGLVDGRRLVGTLDAVGADHLDLAEHPADEPRRPARVSRVLTVPLAAVASVSAVGPSSWG